MQPKTNGDYALNYIHALHFSLEYSKIRINNPHNSNSLLLD